MEDPQKIKNRDLPSSPVVKNPHFQDFPGGPVVKNPPSSAGDAGSILGQGTKIPHTEGQLSPRSMTTEPARLNERARMPQTTEPTHPGACTPQLERENPHATQLERSPCAAMKDPACCT